MKISSSLFPTLPKLTCQEVRQIDKMAVEHYGISSLILMENAGRSLIDSFLSQEEFSNVKKKPKILLCCGKGNNGGDGFVMARRFLLLGYPIEIITTCGFGVDKNEYKGDALVNLTLLQKFMDEPNTIWAFDGTLSAESKLRNALSSADWIIDALLGTGASGPLRSPYDVFVYEINRSGKKVFSIDIPSGLDGDTGLVVSEAIHATVTCTLAALKKGLLNHNALPYVGQLELGDIGIPVRAQVDGCNRQDIVAD